MKEKMMKFWLRLLFSSMFLLLWSGVDSTSVKTLQKPRTSEAYVTLLYGDEFLLGVRVLGKSIRDTATTKDLVVLVSDGVSQFAIQLLKADGWIVEHIGLLANPNQKRPTRFWGVYTKLKIFNMTNYKKVVYLDADTIVLRSIEDLFQCQKFCANLKHSERLNSGVMVVEPSDYVFKDMMSKVTVLPSYTGGDQGFLNSYYPDFPNAHLFEPDLSPEQRKSQPERAMERLSTLYNADVGLYMLANKWMVDESEIRVVHYTLGPLKPWDWWTAWLLEPVDLWQRFRVKLEESLPGTEGGKDPRHQLFVKILFILPFILILLFCRHFISQMPRVLLFNGGFCGLLRQFYQKCLHGTIPIYSSVGGASTIGSNKQYTNSFAGLQNRVPVSLRALSIFMGVSSVLVSVVIAALLIPRQVMPWTGIVLAYEWAFLIFFILSGKYLDLVNAWGKSYSYSTLSMDSEGPSHYDSGKGHQRQLSGCDAVTIYYGLGFVILAILIPSLPFMFKVSALFLRLGIMVGTGFVLAIFMTYASEHLAVRSFLKGLEDRNQGSTRNFCCGL